MKGHRVANVVEDARTGVTAAPAMDPLTKARYGDLPTDPAAEAGQHSSAGEMLKGRMSQLVKGAGFVGEGGNTPLTNQGDILTRAAEATIGLRTAVHQGYHNKSSVVKSFKPDFLSQFGALRTALETPSVMEMFNAIPGASDAMKSFTAGNLGLPNVVSGLTPFNLVAP